MPSEPSLIEPAAQEFPPLSWPPPWVLAWAGDDMCAQPHLPGPGFGAARLRGKQLAVTKGPRRDAGQARERRAHPAAGERLDARAGAPCEWPPAGAHRDA